MSRPRIPQNENHEILLIDPEKQLKSLSSNPTLAVAFKLKRLSRFNKMFYFYSSTTYE